MDLSLGCIELGNVERSLLKLCIWIIVSLFCHQIVANNVLPVTSDLGYILELIQRLACLEQEPVNEEEPKVINLILCSLLDMVSLLELVMQIITDVLDEEIPEMSRIRRSTVEEKGSKEPSELWSSFNTSRLLQTESPLQIILQESTCQTGSLEGRMDCSLKWPEILKGYGTSDDNEKGPQVKLLSRWRTCKVNPSCAEITLARSPLLWCCHADILLRKLYIKQVMCLWMISIVSKKAMSLVIKDSILWLMAKGSELAW